MSQPFWDNSIFSFQTKLELVWKIRRIFGCIFSKPNWIWFGKGHCMKCSCTTYHYNHNLDPYGEMSRPAVRKVETTEGSRSPSLSWTFLKSHILSVLSLSLPLSPMDFPQGAGHDGQVPLQLLRHVQDLVRVVQHLHGLRVRVVPQTKKM